MLELLAQGERTVDSLATEIGLSLANTSQHLQAVGIGVGLIHKWSLGRVALRCSGALIAGAGVMFLTGALK
jgi:DNA-binding transcriptional ArsR family regulator